MQNRREILRWLATTSALLSASQVKAEEPAQALPVDHDMSAMPANWMGKEQIAMVLYPGFTALDLVGPQYMLAGLMGAKVHLVAETMEPVMSDTGLAIAPTLTFKDCPAQLDILFLPGGGQGTVKALNNPALIKWIASRKADTKLFASVCTGALLLGQAGLLKGKSATTHWVVRDQLAEFGATPVNQRVVWDGNVITGAGVSAGIDLGIAIVNKLRDETYAKGMQLLAEYAPQPMFNAGTPDSAGAEVTALIGGMFTGLRAQITAVAKQHL